MKVVASAKDNKTLPTMKVTCTGLGHGNGGCGSLLEVNGLDIHIGKYDSFGETDTYYYISCPVCNKKTEVFPENSTRDIFRLAKHDF